MLIMKLLGAGDDNNKNRRCEEYVRTLYWGSGHVSTSDSLNLVGADFNSAMVKAASIQAFLFLPWMLYVPHPITGIHFSAEENRIHRYYEFDCDSRIYLGDSLLGEYVAPPSIFSESQERVDIDVGPLDLEKNSALKWKREFMTIPWTEMTNEMRFEIIKAQARNLNFECIASNPPFGNVNKFTVEQMRKYQKSNEAFLARRKVWLDELDRKPHPHTEEMIDQALNLIEEKTGQMAFF